MAKARNLANLISSGGVLADGTLGASEITGLHPVATTGNYADLLSKPTAISHFTNDSNYATTTYVNTQVSGIDVQITNQDITNALGFAPASVEALTAVEALALAAL